MKRRLKAGSAGSEAPRDPQGTDQDAGEAARLAAVALLARRDFAAGELDARLQEKGHPAEAVAAVIADLAAARLLDDSRFASHYVAYHAARGQGPRRIARELAERGVAPPDVESALAAGPDWAARAREVRIRRFGLAPPRNLGREVEAGTFFAVSGLFIGSYPVGPGPRF